MANQTNHKNTEGSSTTLQPATGWEEETGGDICARPQGKPALQRPLRFLHARRCARVCLHVCAHTCMCVRVWELGITPGSYSCASLKEKNPGADHEQPQTTRLLQPTLLPPTFLHRCPQLGPNGSRFFRRALPLPQNPPCLTFSQPLYLQPELSNNLLLPPSDLGCEQPVIPGTAATSSPPSRPAAAGSSRGPLGWVHFLAGICLNKPFRGGKLSAVKAFTLFNREASVKIRTRAEAVEQPGLPTCLSPG